MAAQAPAAGRLAAAIATISARRRPIRERVVRSNKLIRRMSCFLWRQANKRSQPYGAQPENGDAGRLCRSVSENSNARVAGSTDDSGFLSANDRAMVEIFFVESTLPARL